MLRKPGRLPLALGIICALIPGFAIAGTPPHLFLGTDLGYGTVSPYSTAEGSRSGIQTDLKAMLSLYLPHIVLDGGVGWQYGKRSGNDPGGGFRKTFSRGLFFETSARYGNPTGWQIGPVLNYYFNEDVGLGDGRFIASQGKNALNAGVQLFYEIPRKGYRLRFGGRWLTDVNIPQRTTHAVQGSFEIGWPLDGIGPSAPRYVNRREGFTIVQKERSLKRLKVVLDARRIEFDYDRSTLRPEAVRRLTALGQFLANHLGQWETVRISGHTDERGSYDYNLKLSRDRAGSVRTALHQAGIPLERMDTQGYSESMPLDPRHNEFAWARNRRVEFDFTGVQDMDLIIDGVNQSTDRE